MAAVLAFDTSVTSKILIGGKGVVGSLFQALTGTVSSYEHISTGTQIRIKVVPRGCAAPSATSCHPITRRNDGSFLIRHL
ncbi:hypothetical protein NC653_022680 [Populus alba x Populus x berolinensis]|uniref:Uncharacterized protein n=1 Tax=Populus alba x Populus x berolinensis TaxID=444605 RepID=A0AAD6MGR1_9ROSI|nr:hypothetical protein NC653_022680 [Populus alba x Populus x berolinensis]